MAGSNAIERMVDMIELLVDYPRGIMLSDIARKLGLAKSATHRMLATLVNRDYVEQLPELNTYRLGLKLTNLGFRYVAQTGVFDICQPILNKLAQETGELVRMALADNRGLTWGARAQGARFGLRYDPDMGAKVVLHATATGRAWLAALPEAEAVALVAAHGFDVPGRFGPQSVRDQDQLLAELAETRARGFALSSEETEGGMRALAMAIPGGDRAPGSISVAGPIIRLSSEVIDQMVPHLSAAVIEIGALWPMIEAAARSDR